MQNDKYEGLTRENKHKILEDYQRLSLVIGNLKNSINLLEEEINALYRDMGNSIKINKEKENG